MGEGPSCLRQNNLAMQRTHSLTSALLGVDPSWSELRFAGHHPKSGTDPSQEAMFHTGRAGTRMKTQQESKWWKSTERLAIFALLIALVFTLVGFEIASAAVSNSDGTINTCYKVKNGNLRVQVTTCTKAEIPLTLSGLVPIYANVSGTGTLGSNKHATGVVHTAGSGIYKVSFDRSVSTCGLAATATVVPPGSTTNPLVATATPGPTVGDPASEVVITIENPHILPGNTDGDFSLTITC